MVNWCIQFKLLNWQVCLQFHTCYDFSLRRLHTSNLDDFVKYFYELSVIFISYELE